MHFHIKKEIVEGYSLPGTSFCLLNPDPGGQDWGLQYTIR